MASLKVDGGAHRSNLLFDKINKPRKAGFAALAGLNGPPSASGSDRDFLKLSV
jgi:hypothetical protein